MVIDIIVKIFNAVLGAIVNILPVATLPSALVDSIDFVVPFLETASAFFPVMTLLGVLLLIVSIEFLILIFKGLIFVYKLIPGKFT